MANQPDIIPMAWAENNSTADSIPETTSESGKASWDQGFPVETSLPLSQGGVPPKYGDFNGILKILSQFALFAQQGGQYAWNNTLAYGVGSIVLGTDGNLYRAAQESTAVNPVGDASGKWERVVSQSDLASISATAAQAAAAANTAQQTAESAQSAVTTLNGNVVKLSGDQTVGGAKTFTSTINAGINLFVARGTTSNELTMYGGSTSNNGACIFLYGGDNSSNGQFRIRAAKNTTYCDLIGTYNGNITWNGQPIQTSSDERLKTPLTGVPDAVLDAWGAVGWGQFQYLDAVEAKGADKARLHLGLIAQRVKAVFEERGLDACAYGILCHEERPATDEEPAVDLWMVRYTEALAMETAYQRRRADRAEARISVLERRLNEMESALASLIAPVGDETYAGSEEGEAQA